MHRLSIRWKLTLWYGVVLSLSLTGFGGAVYFTMRHQMRERIDEGLTEELADVLSEVRLAHNDQGLREWLERRFAHHEGFDFQITRSDGDRFFANRRLGDTVLPAPENGASSSPAFRDVGLDDRRWRVVAVGTQGPAGMLTVQVARSLASFKHELSELLFTLLLTGPLSLLATVGGGYFLARRALAPVDRITATANDISADRLSRRIEIVNPEDELGALGQTLNRMIERLERSFAEMQRFTADAAHELRTPLAVIRNEAEVALRMRRTPEEYAQVLENLLEEVNRLSQMAEQLLFLSRQDAGLHPSVREEVAGDGLLRDVAVNMQLVAQEKGIELSLGENAPCLLVSDPRQLRRVLYNLLDNAIKYTQAGGQVVLTGVVEGGIWSVTVKDTGVGIEAEHLPHIFDRFYRVDSARSGDGSGAGLGLSICRSIIHGFGGRITLTSMPGQGTTLLVAFPVSQDRDRAHESE